MAGQTWVNTDKSEWGDGPWQDEPDKAQWIDEATGLDCLIVRNDMGALCGYVGVPPDHPWHGVGYNDCRNDPQRCDGDDIICDCRPDQVVDVHGGLTFSAACRESTDPSQGICHVPEPGRPADVWWFGFDCAHAHDFLPGRLMFPSDWSDTYRTVGYVRAEVASLARQLAAEVS